MKLILNEQRLQVVVRWNFVKAMFAVLISGLRRITSFTTILLPLLIALEVHRLLDMLSR